MIAIIFMKGTKYACNDYYHRDSIWLQSQILNGPHILAIIFMKGTKYACNDDSKLPNMILVISFQSQIQTNYL